MVTRYGYIVGACTKYVPELCALLNSLDYVGNQHDVHVLGIHLPVAFTSQFDKLNYEVIYHVISEREITESRGVSEITCRKRYWYTADIGKSYGAMCVLDADLVFVRDPTQFFVIAEETGYILGPTKEQNKVYDHEHHQANGKWIIAPGTWNDKDLCNCPLFIDAVVWEKPLRKSWDIFINQGFKAPDMDAMNICFLEAGAHDNIVKLPGLQWLGTNEQHLKPYIRVVTRRDGKLWTENGLEIFSFHGQYYKPKWRACQLANRHRCATHYLGCSDNPDNMALGAMNLLTDTFNKMLDYKIQVEKKDYIPK